eukprot:gene11371-12068_t
MREEILSNASLRPLDATALTSSSSSGLVPIINHSNKVLADWKAHSGKDTWLDLPWLLIETYMYLRVAEAIRSQPKLAAMGPFDPFQRQKESAFVMSHASVCSMGAERQKESASVMSHASVCSMGAEVDAVTGDGGQAFKSGGGSLDALKEKLYQYSLWGNKTDLSLLVDASKIDPAALAVSASKEGQPFLIVDEFEAVWDVLKTSYSSGVTIPTPARDLDTELRTALAQAVDSSSREFSQPYLCSVREAHSEQLRASMRFVARSKVPNARSRLAVVPRTNAEGLELYGDLCLAGFLLDYGLARCTPDPFCWMATASPDLYADLSESSLLIFKGDLNYRKLSFDCRWPWTTPFKEALMGFAPAPFVTLRTLKADVMAGLKEGQGEALDKVDADWQVNGKFGIIQSNV